MATRAKKRTSRRPAGAAGLDAARLDDLKVATKTIGATAAARLTWVVRFVDEDPATWHSAMRAAYGDCLVALSCGGFPDNFVELPNLPPPLAPEKVTDLHADLGAMLRPLLSNGGPGAFEVPIQTEGGITGIIRLTGVGVRPAQFTRRYGHVDSRSAIVHRVVDLLEQAGGRLIACPACKKPFVAVRKQRFCKTRCAQRVRNERKAERRTKKGGS